MLFGLFSDPLKPGTMAPPFTMKDQDGNEISLLKLRGKNVILFFYPGDNTPGCTKQACDVRDSYRAVKSKNAVVFGVNPGSADSHKKFVSKHELPFPLIIDRDQQVAKLYNCDGLIIKRTVYLINPNGVIKFAQRGMPKMAEVLKYAE